MDDVGPGARIAPKLIDSLYAEAMALADTARAYFDRQGRADRMALEPVERVGFSSESLKVTTRLMHVIAWLLTRRAVEAGELSRADGVSPERRLGSPIASDEAAIAALPEAAAELVRASSDLYDRIARLERGEFPENPSGQTDVASPVRSMLSRIERSF